jgi:hypothetical protein
MLVVDRNTARATTNEEERGKRNKTALRCARTWLHFSSRLQTSRSCRQIMKERRSFFFRSARCTQIIHTHTHRGTEAYTDTVLQQKSLCRKAKQRKTRVYLLCSPCSSSSITALHRGTFFFFLVSDVSLDCWYQGTCRSRNKAARAWRLWRTGASASCVSPLAFAASHRPAYDDHLHDESGTIMRAAGISRVLIDTLAREQHACGRGCKACLSRWGGRSSCEHHTISSSISRKRGIAYGA